MENFKVVSNIGWNREAFDYLIAQIKGESKADFLKSQILKYQLPQEEFEELILFFQTIEKEWNVFFTKEEKKEVETYFALNYGEIGCLAQLLLFFDELKYDESLDSFYNRMMNLSQEEINQGIMEKFCGLENGMGEMTENEDLNSEPEKVDTMDILKCIGDLQLTNEEKWVVQDIYMNFWKHSKRVFALIKKAVALLQKEAGHLIKCQKEFESYWTLALKEVPLNVLLKKYLQLDIDDNPNGYQVYPSVMEMSTIKVMENGLAGSARSRTFYGLGILFGKSYNFSRRTENLQKSQDLFVILKLLSDKSKFEILQFVADDWKYGSELVKETGLTAATISYHMNTLVQARLVDIKKDEKKVYFRQNKDYVSEMLSFCEKSIQKK